MYKRLLPPPKLKEYVEYFWCGEMEQKAGDIFTHISAASSKAQLLINYEGDFNTTAPSGLTEKTFTAGVYGQTSLFNKYWTCSKKSGLFGVQFYPHALPVIFSIPAIELTNRILDLKEFFGSNSLELTERLITHYSFEEKVKIVCDFLEHRIGLQKIKYKSIESAIRQIHIFKGQVDLNSLLNDSCLSQRQFERSFKELAGFSPQTYIKIARFESFLEEYEQSNKSLTQMAFYFGYYDQPHLNHEFKRFTGLSPSQYHALASLSSL